MTASRTHILNQIKKHTVHSEHPAWAALIPKRGQSNGTARLKMFMCEAEYGLASVVRLKTFDDIPGAVAIVLKAANFKNVKAAPQAALQNLDWTGVDITFGAGEAHDLAGLVMADAGVAETGTLVISSGENAPTGLNFLPDVHIVVLREQDIHANYETVWMNLKTKTDLLPRTVNWITGPSRTADIEQTMLLGAHGPRKLVILLIHEKSD